MIGIDYFVSSYGNFDSSDRTDERSNVMSRELVTVSALGGGSSATAPRRTASTQRKITFFPVSEGHSVSAERSGRLPVLASARAASRRCGEDTCPQCAC